MASEDIWLPLYEAKLIHQYDHRYATYEDNSPRDVTVAEHEDSDWATEPHSWVQLADVQQALRDRDEPVRSWLFGYRAIANPENARSTIAAILPFAACGNSIALIKSDVSDSRLVACLLANWNSIVLDYIGKLKRSNPNVNMFVVQQFPIFAPTTFTPALCELIVPRVIELTYTSLDVSSFARDCGYEGEPYRWDIERRLSVQSELDGIFAHLYGLSLEEFTFILDSFRVLEGNERRRFGEYRTKRLCLEAYDYFAPETLIELDTVVKAIETGLRRLIVQRLGQSPTALQDSMREKLIERQAEQLKGKATPVHASSLPIVLESAYLFDLQKIMCNGEIWHLFEVQFGPKSELQHHFTRLGDLRNPLAHSRTMSEEARKDGEAAVAWFQERLGT